MAPQAQSNGRWKFFGMMLIRYLIFNFEM